MSVKSELNSLRYLTVSIKSKKRQLDELVDLKTTIKSPRITGMPKSNCFQSADKLDSILDKICFLECDIAKEIDDMIDKKIKWKEKFKELPSDEKTVLELRYFENMSWENIATELNYAERTVFNIHGKALFLLNNKNVQ